MNYPIEENEPDQRDDEPSCSSEEKVDAEIYEMLGYYKDVAERTDAKERGSTPRPRGVSEARQRMQDRRSDAYASGRMPQIPKERRSGEDRRR